MPASSDCAPASSRRQRPGVRQRRHALLEWECEHLAPSRQSVEDGAVLEAEPQLHGVGQCQRDHGGPARRRRRPGGELVPGGVGVHGRHAEHVPVDRPVRQERHGGEEVDLLLGETVETAGHDQLDGGPVVLAHGGGQALHLLPAGRARRDGLPVPVVVRVHLGGRKPERPLSQGSVQRRLHGIEVRRARRAADGALAHDQPTQRRVPDEEARVDRDAAVQVAEPLPEGGPVPGEAGAQRGERHAFDPRHHPGDVVGVLRRQRRQREPAIAAQHRRHAVQRGRARIGVPEELGVVVGVQVNEAGGHEHAAGVDHAGLAAHGAAGVGPDRDDPLALDHHVGAGRRRAGAVDHAPAADGHRHAGTPHDP